MNINRIMIVDDQQIFRVLLREILSDVPEMQVVGEASGGQEAIDMAEDLSPDVVLMDIELNTRVNGIEAGKAIKKRRPRTGIVLFSTHKSGDFIVSAPGWSYLLKNNVSNIETLINAINGASWGLQVIDPEVLEAIRSGSTDHIGDADASIAAISRTIRELGVSAKTPPRAEEEQPISANVRVRGASYSGSVNPLDYMTKEQRERIITFTLEGYTDEYIAAHLQVQVTQVQDWRELISDDLGIERVDGMDSRHRLVAASVRNPALLGNAEHVRQPTISDSGRLLDLSQTPDEGKAVLKLVSQGLNNEDIALQLGMSPELVQEYLNLFYSILGIGGNSDIDPRLALTRAYMENFTNPQET